MYTMDTVLSAAIAEDYIEHVRVARKELEHGRSETSLMILQCAKELIAIYLTDMSHDEPSSGQEIIH